MSIHSDPTFRAGVSYARHWVAWTIILVSSAFCPSIADSLIEIEVPPEQTGITIPICVDMNPARRCLAEVTSGKEVLCQVDRRTGKLWFVLDAPQSTRGAKRLFRFCETGSARHSGFHIENNGTQIILKEKEKAVLAFNYAMVLHEKIPGDRRRACYVHPLYGPSGEVITDDFPKDHYHHRGLFWAWPKVAVGNEVYDLWTIKGMRQHFEKLVSMELGPVYGELVIQSGWYTDDKRKVMDELFTIRAYSQGMMGRVIDLELRLTAASENVTIDSSTTGYGGLSLRFAPRSETIIYTSEGKEEGDANRTRFAWSDLSGKFAGASDFCGVTIIDSPSNPVYPTAWSNRYYGFLNPSFTALAPWTVGRETPLVFRYRLWIHKGDANSGNAKAAYLAYLNTPSVKVIKR